VGALRRGRERWASDERILGRGDFVARVLREAEHPPRARTGDLNEVLVRVAAAWKVTPAELTGGGRRGDIRAARYAGSYLGVRELGQPAARVGRALRVSTQSVLRGVERGPAILAARGIDPKGLLRHQR
jgi:chromosomal replication initiation ATPase DnaA